MASVARGAAGKAQAAHGNLIPGNPKENGLRRSHVSRRSTQHYSVCDNTACSLSTHTVSLDNNPSFYPISLSCLCTHKTHRRLCKLKENRAVFLHSDRKKKEVGPLSSSHPVLSLTLEQGEKKIKLSFSLRFLRFWGEPGYFAFQ